jgi:flagellar protein FlaG
MTQQSPPKITLVNTEQYREDYANSVQIRISVWDFLLVFGRIAQTAPDALTIHNWTAVYMSPQQSKALLNLLQQNVNQYEAAFGPISLEAQQHPGGIVQ